MTSALVLGGGGPLGLAWQAGLLTGLAGRGLDMAGADLVLGTSAGAVIGAALTAGLDLTTLADQVAGPGRLPVPPGADGSITGLMKLTAQATDPVRALERVTEYALAADTLAEAEYLATPLFAAFAGVPWPAAFQCTAIDIDAGRRRVWDAAAGTELAPALAASCALPGLFPPVAIAGHRHIDGGVFSPLNADLAAGHQNIIIVSCFALAPPGTPPGPAPAAPRPLAEVGRLRAGGSDVTCIEPGREFLVISDWGAGIMNTARAAQAYEAGLRQADTTPLEV